MEQKKAGLNSPEIKEITRGLDQNQLNRFWVLFNKKRISPQVLSLFFVGLAVYSAVVAILLHPGYSWLIVLIVTIFMVFYIRALFKGTVGQAMFRFKDYGLVLLPFVAVSLAGLFGVLIWFHNNAVKDHERYLENHAKCIKDETAPLRYDGSYHTSCETILREARHQRRLDQHDDLTGQLSRGIIVSGISLAAIAPLLLYYSKTITDKRNNLVAEHVAEQIKKTPPTAK